MGYAIARRFAALGARVVLVSGPTQLILENAGVQCVNVTSADEMLSACKQHIKKTDIAVFAAAVADYAPESPALQKIKKQRYTLELRLRPTPDIAATLGKEKGKGQFFVGFALETENAIASAKTKLKAKNFDLIVVNSTEHEGAGFGTDTNRVSIIDRSGNIDNFELKHKDDVAADIVEKIRTKCFDE